MVTGKDRSIIDKAISKSNFLDDRKITDKIFQGLITSADDIYHMKKISSGKYLCNPNSNRDTFEFEVNLEDEIMKPLVSGEEAKRYLDPETETFILFPYSVTDGKASLIDKKNMKTDFPLAWKYLKKWEDELRSRESGKFDDKKWYRFGRSQNLVRQKPIN